MYLLQVLLGDEGIKRDLNIVLVVERLSSVGIKPQATDGTSVLSLEFISPAQRKQFIFTSLPPSPSPFPPLLPPTPPFPPFPPTPPFPTWMPSCVVPSSSHGGGELVLSAAGQCAPQRLPPLCAVGTLVLSPTLLPTPLRREGCHQGRPGSNLALQSGMGALNHAVLEQGFYLFLVCVCVCGVCVCVHVVCVHVCVCVVCVLCVCVWGGGGGICV